MDDLEALKRAFRGKSVVGARGARAARTRAIAFAPGRILLRLAFVPVTTLAVTVSLFTATSQFGREDSFRHLVAMGGCEAAAQVGLIHISEGQPGYHLANDPDEDGIACEDPTLVLADAQVTQTVLVPASSPDTPTATAKFLRP